MTEKQISIHGRSEKPWRLLRRYGFAASLALLLIATILWVVSGSATQNPALARKLCLSISIILLAWGIDELIFFFPFAAVFSLLAMVLTVVALLKLKSLPE